MKTLNEAKKFVAVNIVAGCKCPCCSQNVRIYKQKLVRPMIEGLALLYRIAKTKPFPEDYIHTPSEFLKYSMSSTERNLARLRHWELIESAAPGMWRLTDKGRRFIEGSESVPHAVFVWNSKCFGKDDSKMVDIGTVMGAAFEINAA